MSECDVCDGASGGHFVGVCALRTGPMSVAFCGRCLKEGAEPEFVFEYLYDTLGNDRDIVRENIRPGLLGLKSWIGGRYVIFSDWLNWPKGRL